jgi:hypothetical protein
MKIKTLALICLLASLNGAFSIRAQNATPPTATPPVATAPAGTQPTATPPAGAATIQQLNIPGRPTGPRMMVNLTPEERKKLSAATTIANKDPKVLAAMEKMRADAKDYREIMNAAMLAADPTIEPILKRMQEARDQAMAALPRGTPPAATPPAANSEVPKAAK